VAAWGAIVVASVVVGAVLRSSDRDVFDTAFPLRGRWQFRLDLRLVPALCLGAALVALAPLGLARLRWRPLLVLGAVASATWAAVVAMSRGGGALTAPLLTKHEYLPLVERLGSASEFLSTFTERLVQYPTHVKGHPPGMVLVLLGLDRVGLEGAGWASAACILGGAAAVPAVLVVARALAGERVARGAAPFLVLAPAVVWVATSADGFYAGITAWAVALTVLGSSRAADRRGSVLLLAGGVLFGVALHLSYGMAVVVLVVGLVLLAGRRWRPLALVAAGIGAVVLGFLTAGFWWLDGLQATQYLYRIGLASRRPYGVFLLANVSAFALALGPAVAVALVRLRHGRTWLLVGAALLAAALANVSGYSKGEVERIWLPFVPWVLLATWCLARPSGGERRWLAVQVSTTLALEAWILSPW
jgi:hypothetical protein